MTGDISGARFGRGVDAPVVWLGEADAGERNDRLATDECELMGRRRLRPSTSAGEATESMGLRSTRLRPAVAVTAASVGGFLIVTLLLSLALGVEESPTRQMLDRLDIGSAAAAFVVVTLLICVVAPSSRMLLLGDPSLA